MVSGTDKTPVFTFDQNTDNIGLVGPQPFISFKKIPVKKLRTIRELLW